MASPSLRTSSVRVSASISTLSRVPALSPASLRSVPEAPLWRSARGAAGHPPPHISAGSAGPPLFGSFLRISSVDLHRLRGPARTPPVPYRGDPRPTRRTQYDSSLSIIFVYRLLGSGEGVCFFLTLFCSTSDSWLGCSHWLTRCRCTTGRCRIRTRSPASLCCIRLRARSLADGPPSRSCVGSAPPF